MTATTTRPADVLTWGHGPRTLEVFLEPTCPFSGRAFGKFDELMARAGDDRLTLKIRLLPQPWHTSRRPSWSTGWSWRTWGAGRRSRRGWGGSG